MDKPIRFQFGPGATAEEIATALHKMADELDKPEPDEPLIALDLTNLPETIVRMLESSSPLIRSSLINLLKYRGPQWVLDHKGLLESQAEYIDSL